MSNIRFGWLGESRRAALCQLICNEVVEWSHQWWVHHASDKIDVRWVEYPDPTAQRTNPFRSSGPSSSMMMFLGAKGLDGLGCYLASAIAEGDAGWASRIGEEALNDLSVRIYRRGGIAEHPPLEEGAPSHEMERADLGSAHVAIVLGRLAWTLAMDRRLVDRLVPPSSAPQTGLISRQSALGGVPLRVTAVIDFGSVTLTDLSDLHVGEMLVGDRGLDEPLQLHVQDHGVVAKGYLRRLGTQRAVLLDGINSQEQHKP